MVIAEFVRARQFITVYWFSLATSPSPPGRSRGHAAKRRAVEAARRRGASC